MSSDIAPVRPPRPEWLRHLGVVGAQFKRRRPIGLDGADLSEHREQRLVLIQSDCLFKA